MKEEEIIERIHTLVKELYTNRKEKLAPGKTLIKTGLAIYDHKEVNAVIDSIIEGKLGLAQKGKEFEKKIADYLECKYAVFVNSGSTASLLALAGIKHKYKLKKGEIITPACGFPTTINPIIQLGFTPVFVDVDETYNITPEAIKKAITKNTVGIIFAHTLGNPAKVDEIAKIANEKKLFLIEDCSDAYGALYDGKKCGSFGDAAITSFYPAHNITTGGEGGAVTTSDYELNKIFRSLRDWGRECICEAGEDNRCGRRFEHTLNGIPYDHKHISSTIGFNFKPTEMQAAMGLKQFERLEGFNQKRIENYAHYKEAFSDLKKYFDFISIYPKANPVLFGFPIIIKDSRINRKEFMEFLNKNNIATRLLFGGNLTYHPAYKDIDFIVSGKLDNTDRIMKYLVWIGIHAGIGIKEIDYIKSKINEFINSKKLN